MNKSIKLVGVGGQGTILATKILCSALIDAGYDVKMSEIHGMSQRGGSVSSEIRFGDKVFSPVIEKGHADILVAFEQMEAARYMNYLKKEGLLTTENLLTSKADAVIKEGIYLEKETGLSIMRIEEKLDAGPICNTYKIEIKKLIKTN